jgi:hypothetical protein
MFRIIDRPKIAGVARRVSNASLTTSRSVSPYKSMLVHGNGCVAWDKQSCKDLEASRTL